MTDEENMAACIEGIIDNWDEWDAEAQHAAQCEQDDEAYRHVMRELLAAYVGRMMGWTVEDGE